MRKLGFIIVLLLLSTAGIVLGTKAVQELQSRNGIQGVVPRPDEQVVQKQDVIDNPERLSIPVIGVDAAVENVGLDGQGRMDVPRNSDNVAWYEMGYKPGEKGNAVFAGHLDRFTGEPAVFWNISGLRAGDKIIVSGKDGKTLTYGVVGSAEYLNNDFPLEEVFGSSDNSMLNLITCVGQWDVAAESYSHRYVVYSQKIEN